ncbi:MAG: aminoglycoside phosphotransferase family protein [Segetibacter sp.]
MNITCLINSIPLTGFGQVFDWSDETLSKNYTWKAFLDNEIELDKRIQIFHRNKMMSYDALEKLRSTLEKIGEQNLPTVLNHGDIRRKNVLVNAKGEITAIIDWGEACSNIAPYWDLSIALHDLSIDDKQFFLEGYGMKPKEYERINEAIKSLNLINYAPVIDELAKKEDKNNLEYYRLRLSGHLDLYAIA